MQECNYYYKKSHRASSNMCARVDVQQNELCAFPVQVNRTDYTQCLDLIIPRLVLERACFIQLELNP